MTEHTNDPGPHGDDPGGGAAKQRSPWRYLKLGALLAVALAGAFWVGRWFYHQHTHVTGNDARVVAGEITVSSRLAGRLTHFPLKMGDRLAEGDTVASLYSRPDRMRLKSLEAKVARTRAQIDYERQRVSLSSAQLKGGIRETRDRLKADESALKSAKAVMESAQKTYQRSKDLIASGAVSVQKRDEDYYNYLDARAALERAKRQVAIDRTALANARTGLMTSPTMPLPNPDLLRAQLKVTRQALKQAEAELREQQVRVDDMTVVSPIDGVVDKTFVDPGEYVSPGQPILMMHRPGNVWVEARIKETEVDDLQVGQPVVIHVDAYPDARYRGRVAVIGGAATSEFALLPNPNPSGNFTKITQRIPVRIAIDQGKKSRLSPGMMVEVDVDVSTPTDEPGGKD